MKDEEKIKIIMADDHPIFRSGLRQIIEEDSNIEILGEADNGEIALDLINRFNPEISLLDIDMPVKTGLEVLRELNDRKHKTKVIFLTVYADEDIFDEAMELGISGYVLKDSAISEIAECINSVHNNKYYISPSVTNLLIRGKDKTKKFESHDAALDSLTKSEKIILKLVSESRTSKEISELLEISYKTVENHRTNIINKLGLKGANSLIKYAIINKTGL